MARVRRAKIHVVEFYYVNGHWHATPIPISRIRHSKISPFIAQKRASIVSTAAVAEILGQLSEFRWAKIPRVQS